MCVCVGVCVQRTIPHTSETFSHSLHSAHYLWGCYDNLGTYWLVKYLINFLRSNIGIFCHEQANMSVHKDTVLLKNLCLDFRMESSKTRRRESFSQVIRLKAITIIVYMFIPVYIILIGMPITVNFKMQASTGQICIEINELKIYKKFWRPIRS